MSIIDSPMMDSFRHPCVLLEKTRVSDGMGGSRETWVDGMTFDAIFSDDNSLAARVAEKDGMTSTYTAVVKRSMGIRYHDVLRRLSDGKVFRVTNDGDDKKTPDTSSMEVRHLILERWELPSNE